MSIPDYQSLMLPVLVAAAKGEVRIGQVAEELGDQLGLSPEDRSQLLPSGRQTVFSNRVHWAKSYLSKAQLVEITRRGLWFSKMSSLARSLRISNIQIGVHWWGFTKTGM